MALRWLAGIVAVVLSAMGLGVAAAPAGAVYGLLDHYEVCSSDGDYARLSSISVRENVYVADRSNGSGRDFVRVLTQGGHQLTAIRGTGRPGETFTDPIVGASAVGALYVIDNPDFKPRLFKFSGGIFERELTTEGTEPFRRPTGLVTSRPGGRGVPSGEVLVLDIASTGGGIIKAWEADGNFSEQYIPRERGLGNVGISAVRGGVAVAASGRLGVPAEISLHGAGSKPLHYIGSFNITEDVHGVAGAPDDTWWVLDQFAGLEHYGQGGNLIERVPIPGALDALSVAPDGKVWVVRGDGLLRIGQGGGVIPPSQYGRGKCGAPQIDASVPSKQRVVASRKLVVSASCSEQCTMLASGRLSVPGGAARTFKLASAKRRLSAGARARLRLGLSRKAAAALRRASARGQRSTAVVTLRAADTGKTESSRQVRLTIG